MVPDWLSRSSNLVRMMITFLVPTVETISIALFLLSICSRRSADSLES